MRRNNKQTNGQKNAEQNPLQKTSHRMGSFYYRTMGPIDREGELPESLRSIAALRRLVDHENNLVYGGSLD
jgi:hypothetical protein